MSEADPPNQNDFPLRNLLVDKEDKRGQVVREILWAVHDFKIYKTDKGIGPQFSDDPDKALEQRAAYMALGPELADLNQQINLLKTGWGRVTDRFSQGVGLGRDPRLSYYERETARGMAQALNGDPETGRATIRDLTDRISKRLSNILRVLYFSVCGFAAVIITLALTFYAENLPGEPAETVLGLKTFELCVAAVMGSLGALLSTAIGLRSLAIDPTATMTINVTYAVQRMLVGVLGAVILHITLESGIVGNLLGTTASRGTGGDAIYKLAFISVLAGFSERLVPNLLDRTADKYGNTGGEKENAGDKNAGG